MKDRKRFHNKSEADIFHNLKVAIYSVIKLKSFQINGMEKDISTHSSHGCPGAPARYTPSST